MNLLIISNMYPSKQKPYAGVFVKNQYNFIKKQIDGKDTASIFYMKRTFTNKIGTFIKYIKTAIKFIPILFKKYDVIHLHFFLPLIFLVYIYKIFHPKAKAVVTFHGNDIKSIKSKKQKKLYSFLIKKTDFVISVGKDLKIEIESKLNRKVNRVLSAGVNSDVFYVENGTKKKFDFIFVGSFIHRKGVDLIIEAIKEIKDSKISFCFVGSGFFENEVENLKKEFNVHVYKNQTQEQLRSLYNESKFLLFPSRNEPFGLIATESLFCGTPIIVSKVGGLVEQLIENETGYFASTKDEIIEVVKKTKKLTTIQYNKLVNNSINANKQFSLQNICEELIIIYKSI